jgi:hypothetical protein
MIPLIERNRSDIGLLCQKHGVTRLELFGSAARDDFETGRSDLDFLVEFGSGSRTDLFHRYFGLRADLENLLGCAVDLVMLGALKNPYFVRSVNESRAVLYAA